jgi:hypothetical protein
MTDDEYNSFVAYYVMSGISIACNLLILAVILIKYRGFNTPFLVLLALLHFSNIMEDITLIPFIFKGSRGFCVAVEAFKFYFGVMNIFVILFLVQAHRLAIFHHVQSFSPKIKHFACFMIFIFPLIAFLPFSTNAYQYPDYPWCSLPTGSSIAWAVFVQYIWVWLVILLCIITNLYIMQRVLFRNRNYPLFRRYAMNSGAYAFVSAISWIPRSFEFYESSESTDKRFFEYFPMLIAGVLYAVLFFINQEGISKFEASQSNSIQETMTWDASDILDIMDQFADESRKSMSFFIPTIFAKQSKTKEEEITTRL